MTENSFGFGAAVQAATEIELPPVKPKVIDRQRSQQGRVVAAESGFHRRAPVSQEPVRSSSRKAVGRVRLADAAPRRGVRFQGEARVQLNMAAPVPVAEAWRALMDEAPIGQWELLEAAIPLLRKHLNLE
ncbi:MAG: hypothetical protein M3T55_08990 [Pseudomonadota bacterium]|nr:hypothetical protein [Pseudomonadota bacterium]